MTKNTTKRLLMSVLLLLLMPISIWAETITLTSETTEITIQDGDVLTGTGGNNTQVTIADGARITLNDATIGGGIICAGTATITLVGSNSVTGKSYMAGIQVGGSGTTLTICGDGSLTSTGGWRAAGIGLSITWESDVSGGDIVIEGGTITAIGSSDGAGLGTGVVYKATATLGNIIIKGGSVTAICGELDIKNNGIGAGYVYPNSSCTIAAVKIYDDIEKVETTSISKSVVYMHGETDVTTSADNYFHINSFKDHIVIAKKGGTSYAITTGQPEHGTVTCAATATYMEKVTVTPTPASQYRFNRLIVTDGQGNDVETEGNSFMMPKSEVTVSAEFLYGNVLLSDNTAECTAQDGDVLIGTGGTNTHVTIADGATVTLSSVNITAIPDKTSHKWGAGIACEGDATIILEGDNAVKGGYLYYPGLFVPEGYTLTIKGAGSLVVTGAHDGSGIGGGKDINSGNIVIEGGIITATGGWRAAGIGGGSMASCGDITITGGTVIATGGDRAAAIGGGMGWSSSGGINYSTCGDITITRSVTSVTAIMSDRSTYSIGEGNYGKCGMVTIGGKTGHISESPYTYTPSGSLTSTVHFDANGASGTMDDWLFTYDGAMHTIPLCSFITPDGMIFIEWNTAADGSGYSYKDGQQVIDISDVTLYAKWRPLTESVPNGDLTLYDSQTLTGTGDKNTHVTIADGATVTLSGVDITTIRNDDDHQWAGITCEGDATIILEGDNAVKGGYHSAGIFVPRGKTLTIQGDGSLNATGQYHGAGIGSGGEEVCGNIIIKGGTITATGGSGAAGIGCGYYGSCGDITITGGNITALCGATTAAAIGCGSNSSTDPSSCGNITITNGVTRIIATKTGKSSSTNIIGTTGSHSTCGSITIAPDLIDALSNNNKTRTLYPGLVLFDTEENTTAIETYADGDVHDVQLRGHTLYKDGEWNTLVLPFDLELTSSPLAGDNVVAKVLITTSNLNNGTLTLNFSDAPATIPAGTPFIIKWDNTGVNLADPIFEGMTIDNTNRDVAFTGGTFKGNYAPLEIIDANRNDILLLAAGNKLGYAKTDRTIANKKALGSCHAYFYIPANGGSQTVRQYELDFGEGEETTGIEPPTISPEGESTEASPRGGLVGVSCFDLQGRRVSALKKGLYIVNGHKVVVK